jgi:hypothetical protein
MQFMGRAPQTTRHPEVLAAKTASLEGSATSAVLPSPLPQGEVGLRSKPGEGYALTRDLNLSPVSPHDASRPLHAGE